MEKELEKDIPLDPFTDSNPPTPRRGSDESSTTLSKYSEPDPIHPSRQDSSTTVLDVTFTGFRDFLLTNPKDTTETFYVHNSQFEPDLPNVTLYLGGDQKGAIVGIAKFNTTFSKSIAIGISDPGSDVTWYSLERTSPALLQREFRFSMHVQLSDHDATTMKRNFVWKRSSRAVVGDEAAYSMQNFKLVEDGYDTNNARRSASDGSGQIVATFASNRVKGWKKKGKLRYVKGVYGEEWEKMVILSCLCLIRRRNRVVVGGSKK